MTVQTVFVNDGSMNVTAGQTYITVATSATTTALKVVTGKVGDWLGGVLVIPSSTSPGAVSLVDSTGGTAITLFAGGSASLSNLVPFYVPVSARSVNGGWFLTTGSTVTCVATGNFS
jgi:hypothetical protein